MEAWTIRSDVHNHYAILEFGDFYDVFRGRCKAENLITYFGVSLERLWDGAELHLGFDDDSWQIGDFIHPYELNQALGLRDNTRREFEPVFSKYGELLPVKVPELEGESITLFNPLNLRSKVIIWEKSVKVPKIPYGREKIVLDGDQLTPGEMFVPDDFRSRLITIEAPGVGGFKSFYEEHEFTGIRFEKCFIE